MSASNAVTFTHDQINGLDESLRQALDLLDVLGAALSNKSRELDDSAATVVSMCEDLVAEARELANSGRPATCKGGAQ